MAYEYGGTGRGIITIQQRKRLDSLIKGRAQINSDKSRALLKKPQVRIAFETLLDQAGLTDDQLATKLRVIVGRKPTAGTNQKSGIKVTNQTSVDANTIQAIRMIWQAKGKFTEKVEHIGDLAKLPEEQLDAMIKDGVKYIHIRKNKIEDSDAGGRDGV